jgi:anti-anti-sigma factor
VSSIRRDEIDTESYSLRVERNGPGHVVHLSGEIDIAATAALRQVLDERSDQVVVLDFSAVTFLDSSAIGVLVGALHRAETDGGTVILRDVRPAQRRVIELVGLAETFGIDREGPL